MVNTNKLTKYHKYKRTFNKVFYIYDIIYNMEKFNFNNTPESNVKAWEKKFQYYMKDFPLTENELHGSILDVGTGVGDFIKYLREVLGNKSAIGVDKSTGRIDQTYEGLMVADGLNLPFDNESFETVIAHNYLPMFVSNPVKMRASIMELIRVTKKSGRMMGDISNIESSIKSDRVLRENLGEEYSQRDVELHDKKIQGINSMMNFLEELKKDDSFEVDVKQDGNKSVLIISKK